jgi:hypothetical protein
MSHLSVVRRAATAVVASALAATLVAATAPAQAVAPVSSPAGHAATWLDQQLTNGLIVEGGFNNYGTSIDLALALRAIGHHPAAVRRVNRAVEHHVGRYIGRNGEQYAGATAKTLVLVEATGGDPRSFGGVNLVRRLSRLVSTSGPTKGRIVDQSQYGDFANVLGQILAVRGLTGAHSGYAGMTRRFLLQQQCHQGYFRLFFSKVASAHQSCGASSPADPDATAYAVIQLWHASSGHPVLRSALRRAAAWLASHQRANGSFLGGTTTATSNTNTTGLAAVALAAVHDCTAAEQAAGWVHGLQVGHQPSGSPLAGQRGAIAYDRAGFKAGVRDGITSDTFDQWVRATSQAAPALLYLHGC